MLDYIEKIKNETDINKKIEMINDAKMLLFSVSPLNHNPVDCVIWVKNESVHANDYNPNSVAPPEMELLATSIKEDGYTQPIVTWRDQEKTFEVVDGFHRHRVGKEVKDVSKSIMGYLPVVVIRDSQLDKNNRIASTIRHNRARGKHNVESMSDIVIELARRNWSDDKIAKNLGMDSDEVLRLKQITGIADMFADEDFSKAWTIEGDENDEEQFEENLEEL